MTSCASVLGRPRRCGRGLLYNPQWRRPPDRALARPAEKPHYPEGPIPGSRMTQPDPSSPGPNPADGRGPPPNASQVEVTQLLHAVNQGDPSAGDRLLPLVYGELRRLAQGYMSQERAGQTLQATALVHEAYLRLIGSADVSWASRAQFFAAAAQAMRRILVERARARGRLKRGGGLQRVELDEHAAVTETARTDLV